LKIADLYQLQLWVSKFILNFIIVIITMEDLMVIFMIKVENIAIIIELEVIAKLAIIFNPI